MIGQRPQERVLLAPRVELEVAEAHERRRQAGDDRAGLGARPAVVEHVADHVVAGGDQRQRARGRHAEMMHCLGTEKLANG